MPKIVLHQWEMSPFCNKVRRCLRYKRLGYDVVNYNGLLGGRAKKLSRVGTLPVVDYDGERIQDSSRIAAFLDARHPEPPLYPQEPQARAAAHFFHEIYFRMLDPSAREKALDLICAGRPRYERAIISLYFRIHYPRKLREQGVGRLERAEVERQFFGHLDHLEIVLAERAWLAGSDLSIGDLSVAAQLSEVVRTSDLAQRIRTYARSSAWLSRVDGAAAGTA